MTRQAVGRLTPSLPILLVMLFTVSATKTPAPSGKPSLHETRSTETKLDQVNHLRLSQAYETLPLRFETNQGQTDPEAKFISRVPGYTLFLTPREAVFSMRKPAGKGGSAVKSRSNKEIQSALRMKLVGASQMTQITGLEPLPGKSNYFTGNDPRQWRTNVPQYGKVRYREVYPGIDLLFYGNQNRLEFDFVVAPKGNPELIRLSFAGAERLRRDESDNLVVQTAAGNVLLQAPLLYQESQSGRRKVAGRYLINGKREVSFQTASYDITQPLIIDPVLVYSTYLGGSGEDGVGSVAVDSAGSLYLTGTTASVDFPTKSALQVNFGGSPYDAFVTKLNPLGNGQLDLVYSTFLGGSGRDNSAHGIAIDNWGNAYVTGTTGSSNFPTQNAFQPTFGNVHNAFVTKLNPAGNGLVYSTYLGGHGTGDGGDDIAIDANGNAFVTGGTSSSDFPTTFGAFQTSGGGFYGDAYVAKFSPSGSLLYSTYLGGNTGHGGEGGYGIVVDTGGKAYVTGFTTSPNFPTTSGAYDVSCGTDGNCNGYNVRDAFVAKLDPAGNGQADLMYSTYLGGSGAERAFDIAVDASGNAYVAGETCSSDFPVVNPFQASYGGGCGVEADGDGFVAKLNAAGTGLIYSTYLGGSSSESAVGIAIDPVGNAYVTGYTFSPDFPTYDPLKSGLTGGLDAFITKLNPAGSALVWSTYLGGSARDGGSAIAVDGSGNVYAANQTNSNDFPTTSGAFQTSLAGSYDGFVVKIASSTSNAAPVITSFSGPLGPLALGTAATLLANFTDADTQDLHTCVLSWDDGLPSTSGTVTETAGSGSCTATRTYTTAGVHTVSVTVVDDHGASASKTFEFVVIYDPAAGFVTGGGWINSPAGAYVADSSLAGKANFGFVSKYKKGASTPEGQTQFQFQVASFNFQSTAYDWLVVAGPKAQYKGVGTVNGAGNYGFLLTARDGQQSGGGGVDQFRIKIWDKNNHDALVYDNVLGASDDIDAANPQTIGGGSIVIHKP